MPGILLAISVLSASIFICSCSGRNEIIDETLKKSGTRYLIYISKRDFLLTVYNRKKNKAAVYKIAYGSNPDRKGKIHEGDRRTPEGVYYIDEILSMDASKSTAVYRKLSLMNKHYFRAAHGHSKYGHSDLDLGDNAYGPRYFGINYPNNKDKSRYREYIKKGVIKPVKGTMPNIGSGIAIHGNSDWNSIGHIASNGCIRMYNSDIVELGMFIQIGTPVIIKPD